MMTMEQPEKYIINNRIEKVTELLVYTNKTLTEISHAMGYGSINHLSSQFKQVIVSELEQRGDHDSIQIAGHMKSYKG